MWIANQFKYTLKNIEKIGGITHKIIRSLNTSIAGSFAGVGQVNAGIKLAIFLTPDMVLKTMPDMASSYPSTD